LGAAGLAGIAGGVWPDAAAFIGTREFTRFTPTMPRETADELIGGWERAVRATLVWSRDKGEPERGKKRKKGGASRKRASSATKKTKAKKPMRKKAKPSRARRR